MQGEPLQIISAITEISPDSKGVLEGGKDEFRLDKSALASILSKVPAGMKVSIVSVVGAFRTGKSFLLTLFLRYLKNSKREEPPTSLEWLYRDGSSIQEGNKNKESLSAASTINGSASDHNSSSASSQPNTNENISAENKETSSASTSTSTSADISSNIASFAWRGGQERMTTGIWMWSEPFIQYSDAVGADVAVLLMDTQGMFDNESTMTLTAQIFGISTLVSSYQIYNVQNSIGEDKLQHLALFSEYGRLALKPTTADESSNVTAGAGRDVPTTSAAQSKDDAGPAVASRADKALQSIRQASTYSTASVATPDTVSASRQYKPFQHLLFLVRDWANFVTEFAIPADSTTTEHASPASDVNAAILSLRAEMTKYLATVVAPRGKADLQSTREQVERGY